jgi:DNA-nicking Smr family endonuclease
MKRQARRSDRRPAVFEEARRSVDTVNQMMRMHSSRGRVGGLLILLLAIALVALPASAAASRAAGKLSPRLAELASPSLRTAAPARQAKALSLAAEGPASLARRGRRVLVYLRFTRGALAAREELDLAGAQVLDASARYQTLTAAVMPSQLHAVAHLQGVAGVTPVLAPMTAAATCPSGAIVSEGDTQLKAHTAREEDGVDGSGVTVGILSDSFDQATEVATKAADDVKSADLPGVGNECGNTAKVLVLKNEKSAAEASDEGRAMAQIVHDLAPAAHIDFASAFNGELAFAKGIKELAAAGAKVIADDVFYFEEPFFQDGRVAVAVNEVVEGGATYFSAAGNDNLLDTSGEHDIASWETPAYRDSGSCPPAVEARAGANGFHCLDFNPDPEKTDRTFGIKVEPGSELTIDLQWDEPWNGVATDLDAYLLNASGFLAQESGEANVETTQMPVEVLSWANEGSTGKTVQLVVNRALGEAAPRVKLALLENGSGVEATEYPRSSSEDVVGPTIFGHSGSASAISVAAVPFNSNSEPEPYSSRGPVIHGFGPVEGTAAAAPLGPPEEVISKPDLTATDCGKTTFFAIFESPFWRFCGTSAAAPHAAAVAALMLDAEPTADPEAVRTALEGSAAPVVGFGSCAVGAGLVEAVGAVEEVLAQTGESASPCESPAAEVEPDEAAAPGNWGSEVPPTPVPPTPPVVAPPPTVEEEETKHVPSPRTFFLQRPSKVIRTRHHAAKAVFRFGSNESEASFVCRVDGSFFRPCPVRLARRFTLGWHVLKVAARDSAGRGDKTPASYSFKVKRVR